MNIKTIFAALLSGILFGFGLTLSQMTNPNAVLAFLDVTGQWEPRLIFVMGAGLIITTLGYRLVFKRKQPLIDTKFHLPTKIKLDKELILGAAIFGIGWGLSGYCPGPAFSGLVINPSESIIFILSMIAGILLHKYQTKKKRA